MSNNYAIAYEGINGESFMINEPWLEFVGNDILECLSKTTSLIKIGYQKVTPFTIDILESITWDYVLKNKI